MIKTNSKNWKSWKAKIDLKTCYECREKNGKIYPISEEVKNKPPIHYYCRCTIVLLQTISAGDATDNGIMGADWYLKYHGILPNYYIDVYTASELGWIQNKGNLNDVAPGKMIFGGVFDNREDKLPDSSGRIWYEADINYRKGRRNSDRILFSNDGLIFVTYDHYKTFFEIQ